jgi:hypothetical protein
LTVIAGLDPAIHRNKNGGRKPAIFMHESKHAGSAFIALPQIEIA